MITDDQIFLAVAESVLSKSSLRFHRRKRKDGQSFMSFIEELCAEFPDEAFIVPDFKSFGRDHTIEACKEAMHWLEHDGRSQVVLHNAVTDFQPFKQEFSDSTFWIVPAKKVLRVLEKKRSEWKATQA